MNEFHCVTPLKVEVLKDSSVVLAIYSQKKMLQNAFFWLFSTSKKK